MRLTSPRFNTNARLQNTANNNPTMKYGSKGLYVRHVQQALIDLGHPLPKSTKKFNTPDGIFGGETKKKVFDFQKKQRLTNLRFGVDGIVGEQTMDVFDRLLRTPVTLPPIPTVGGLTDLNANLAQSLINVLSHPGLLKIRFSAMGVDVSPGSCLMVRKALQYGEITAEIHKMPANYRGVYFAQDAQHKTTNAVLIYANTFMLDFRSANMVLQKVTVIHEATHAFCDIRRIGRTGTTAFTRDQSESVAHIAQATFHRILTGHAETDPFGGLNPIPKGRCSGTAGACKKTTIKQIFG